jgi:uncharacterized phage protein (TIGR02220 family)
MDIDKTKPLLEIRRGMTTTIDHSVRENLGLNLGQYVVADYCAKARPMLAPTGIKVVSESLGLSAGQVSDAMKELIGMQLLEKKENGFFYPAHAWYEAHLGIDVEVTSQAAAFANEVISLFNSINGSRYQPHPYQNRIKVLMKRYTIDHFKSVFTHKKETWGVDPKMSEYNRPATILSTKFDKYLDDANHYWIQKLKHAAQ